MNDTNHFVLILTIILSTSLTLQVFASFLSMRLSWVSRHHAFWLLISLSALLLAVRCGLILHEITLGHIPNPLHATSEFIALIISVLFVACVGWIAPTFLSLEQNQKEARRRAEQIIHYQLALLKLSKRDSSNLNKELQEIIGIDAKTLWVARVSVWFFNQERTSIICQELYKLADDIYERGMTLQIDQCPLYFQALDESRVIAAHDAVTDPRTSEFADVYLKTLKITSMLDVPIRLHGQVIGILCHEHIGAQKLWTLEEEEFAVSIADMISLAVEASELRRTEEALAKRTQELNRSNKELEQFASIAAHDLQEPLNTIGGFTNRFYETAHAKLDANEQDHIQRIQRATVRMKQLIESLLHFSRVTSKALPYENINLESLIKGILSDLGELTRQSHAHIEIGELPQIQGDPLQIRQLFQNLIVNAIKFRDKNRPLKIKVYSQMQDSGMPMIIAEDNGIGFDPKYSERIFEPFQRLHRWSEYEGSGMGLAICRKIVEHHQGQISVKSELGRGSMFLITLPLAEKIINFKE